MKTQKTREELSIDDLSFFKDSNESNNNFRNVNMLFNGEIEFETAIFNVPTSKESDSSILKFVQMRYKEKTFDNFDFIELKPCIKEEEYDTEIVETKKEITELFSEVEKALKILIDGGNNGFRE